MKRINKVVITKKTILLIIVISLSAAALIMCGMKIFLDYRMNNASIIRIK